MTSLYDHDYLEWVKSTLVQLRSQDYISVDWQNLIEEIEDMGKRERRSMETNLVIVLLNLLKWEFQPQCRSGSWKSSIIEHRRRIRKALEDSPSLKVYLGTMLTECYQSAVKQVKAEIQLPTETFSTRCPYNMVEVLNDDFLPQ
jgi:hypothetical protein